MKDFTSPELSKSLLTENDSFLKRLGKICKSCFARESSPTSTPIEMIEINPTKENNDTKVVKEKITIKEIKNDLVIVPVQAASLSPLFKELYPTVPKKKSKKAGLPIVTSLTDGYQVLGNGKETVIVTVTRTQVEFNKTSFRSDLKKKPVNVPLKYWNQRYSIFSRFDEGVLLDEESWYSVTHECIAKAIAHKCQDYSVMDGFAGAGGNVIQFAHNRMTVALEIDQSRIDMLKNNASIYQVLDNIKIVHGDFLEVAKNEAGIDIVFMSPPWGGPDYVKSRKYDIFSMITPDITKIMEVCNEITKNVVLYLPRTAHPAQVVQLFKSMPNVQRKIEFELFCVGSKVKTIACYMGDMNKVDSKVVSKSILDKLIKLPKYLSKDRDLACEQYAKEIDEIGLNQSIAHAYSSKRHPRNK